MESLCKLSILLHGSQSKQAEISGVHQREQARRVQRGFANGLKAFCLYQGLLALSCGGHICHRALWRSSCPSAALHKVGHRPSSSQHQRLTSHQVASSGREGLPHLAAPFPGCIVHLLTESGCAGVCGSSFKALPKPCGSCSFRLHAAFAWLLNQIFGASPMPF